MAGREPVDPKALNRIFGRVVDASGTGIPGAQVHWSRVQLHGNSTYRAVAAEVPGFMEIESDTVDSNQAGYFSLDVEKVMPGGGDQLREVLWISKLGFGVDLRVRQPQPGAEWDLGILAQEVRRSTQIELTAANDVDLGQVGIFQRGLTDWRINDSSLNERAFYSPLYGFSGSLVGRGVLEFPFFGNYSAVRARVAHGGELEWRGSEPLRIQFNFGFPVSLRGKVVPGPDVWPLDDAKVVVQVVGGLRDGDLFDVKVDDQLEWGPIDLPIGSVRSILLWVDLEGFYGPRIEMRLSNIWGMEY